MEKYGIHEIMDVLDVPFAIWEFLLSRGGELGLDDALAALADKDLRGDLLEAWEGYDLIDDEVADLTAEEVISLVWFINKRSMEAVAQQFPNLQLRGVQTALSDMLGASERLIRAARHVRADDGA